MRVLVYGAGNIGCLYAGLLSHAGHDVSILARGERFESIAQAGVVLEHYSTRERTTARPTPIAELQPDYVYELILVAIGREHVFDVLPVLAENRSGSVLFFGNNAAGPGRFVEALGPSRVLLGFPGAAGIRNDGAVRYTILKKADQPTTIGELDGSDSPRIRAIASALNSAGFPVAVSPKIDAWLKTHVAQILPTACGLYMANGDAQRLARTRDALVLMMRGIREGYRVLHAASVPIMPPIQRIFEWLPEPLLVAIAKRMVADESAAIKLGHGVAAREEMKLLAADFAAIAQTTPTPTLDRLAHYLDPDEPPLADGSRELRLRFWS